MTANEAVRISNIREQVKLKKLNSAKKDTINNISCEIKKAANQGEREVFLVNSDYYTFLCSDVEFLQKEVKPYFEDKGFAVTLERSCANFMHDILRIRW